MTYKLEVPWFCTFCSKNHSWDFLKKNNSTGYFQNKAWHIYFQVLHLATLDNIKEILKTLTIESEGPKGSQYKDLSHSEPRKNTQLEHWYMCWKYSFSSVIRQNFFLSKQSQKI